jgi:hypothetical protein
LVQILGQNVFADRSGMNCLGRFIRSLFNKRLHGNWPRGMKNGKTVAKCGQARGFRGKLSHFSAQWQNRGGIVGFAIVIAGARDRASAGL